MVRWHQLYKEGRLEAFQSPVAFSPAGTEAPCKDSRQKNYDPENVKEMSR